MALLPVEGKRGVHPATVATSPVSAERGKWEVPVTAATAPTGRERVGVGARPFYNTESLNCVRTVNFFAIYPLMGK